MKKLLLVALSFAISSMLYAQGTGNFDSNTERNDGFRKDMNQVHELMHNTSIKGEKIDNGVAFKITASAETTVELIKKRFIDEQEALTSYFQKIDISVDALDKGVKISLVSDDDHTVKRLQYYGSASIYRYLHHSVFKNGNGMGFHGMMGHGPGMMHGYGNGREYGPCMMFEEGENNIKPQSYNRNQNQMGYGPNML